MTNPDTEGPDYSALLQQAIEAAPHSKKILHIEDVSTQLYNLFIAVSLGTLKASDIETHYLYTNVVNTLTQLNALGHQELVVPFINGIIGKSTSL